MTQITTQAKYRGRCGKRVTFLKIQKVSCIKTIRQRPGKKRDFCSCNNRDENNKTE